MNATMLAIVFLVLATTAHAQAVFQDTNGNGVFDAGDVDLTGAVLLGATVSTGANLVIAKPLVQRCEDCDLTLASDKRLTILPGVIVSALGEGGEIALKGDEVVVGNKAQVSGIHGVQVTGAKSLTLGDGVRLKALGSGPTYGYGTVFLSGGAITAGADLNADSHDTVDFRATGSLTLGPRAVVVSRHGDVGLSGGASVTVDAARNIKGGTGVLISSTGPVKVGRSRLATARPFLLMLVGQRVEGDPSLWTVPYVLFDAARPNGLYVTQK